MMPNSISDLEINRDIRKVFVRHNINLGWISITSCRGSVMINGQLILLPGSAMALTPALVSTMFKEINRSSGVRQVTTNLTNWEHDSTLDVWKMKKTAAIAKVDNTQSAAKIFDLSKEAH